MTVRKSATDNGFIIFKDQLSLLKLIPNEQLGKAIKELLENFDDLPNKEDLIYEMFAVNIRRYREQSLKAKEDGLRGGNPTLKGVDKGSNNQPITVPLNYKTKQEYNKQEYNLEKENIVKEKVAKATVRFNKPSLEEIKNYVREKGYHFSAEQFYAYYESNGWKVGRNPMKDWKMACVNWDAKERPHENKQLTKAGQIMEKNLTLLEKYYSEDMEVKNA